MLVKFGMLGKLLIFLILTLLTQIGGLVYLFIIAFIRILGFRNRFITLVFFIIVYAGTSFAVTHIAPSFGRQSIPCFVSETTSLKTAHPIFCVFNRNYVNKELGVLLDKASQAVANRYEGTQTLVLDTGFPFLTGFPLLPHLSHDDGRKADLAFYYKNSLGYQKAAMPSPIGYWAFEEPAAGAKLPCKNINQVLSLRWDMRFLKGFWADYSIEQERTAYLLNWLTNEGRQYGLEKILLEPHLKASLGLKSALIKFQGCRAARHDDHIHLQIVDR